MTTPLYVLPNDDTISSQSSIAASVSSISTAASQTSNSENKRGKNRHANFDEATQVIEQENMWRKVNKSKTKQYYQCNKTTTRNAKQCSSTVYVFKHSDTNEASIYRAMCAHSHIEIAKV